MFTLFELYTATPLADSARADSGRRAVALRVSFIGYTARIEFQVRWMGIGITVIRITKPYS